MLLWIVRIVLVIGLVGVAAAIATPKGRLPLALRGVRRIMKMDRGEKTCGTEEAGRTVPGWKRALAILLVLLAVLICVV